MIKINLLPAHILERQRLRSVIMLVALVIVIEAAVLGVVMLQMKRQLADEQVELKYWQEQAAKIGQIESATKEAQAKAQFYGRWLYWDSAIDRYHEAWAEILGEIAKWIFAKVQVQALTPSPMQVVIQGRTTSLEAFRKAYLNISRSPLYSNVSFQIGGVGGGYQQPAAPGARPGAAGVGAPRARAGGGGLQLRLGGQRGESRAAPAAAPRAPRFGMGGAAAARRPGRPGATAATRALAEAAFAQLPISVTFNCVLRPEYGQRLRVPMPPMGGGALAGRRAGAGAAAGGGRPRIQLRMGGGRD